MTIITDYATPGAVLPRIREAYYALLEGRRPEVIEFDAGNGVRRKVQYGKTDLCALRAELSRLESFCGRTGGLRHAARTDAGRRTFQRMRQRGDGRWFTAAHARDQKLRLTVEQREHFALEAAVAERHAREMAAVDRHVRCLGDALNCLCRHAPSPQTFCSVVGSQFDPSEAMPGKDGWLNGP